MKLDNLDNNKSKNNSSSNNNNSSNTESNSTVLLRKMHLDIFFSVLSPRKSIEV
jgi:hypothetical protein